MGIGSVGVTALKLKRRAVGLELKRSYFEAAVRYLRQAEAEANAVDLFTWAGQAAP